MKSRKKMTALAIVLFLVGILLILYPMVSNYLATVKNTEKVHQYDETIFSMSVAARDAEWEKALTYNDALLGKQLHTPYLSQSGSTLPANYHDVLNIEGMMGYLTIPAIDVKLPIYHGIGNDVLNKGVGHIEGSTLPIGGKGGHSLLTAHTGTHFSLLFTNLEKMKSGDRFYIHVLGKEMAYKVDQIKVVEPQDVSALAASPEGDYVTLITCTPYGINSQRLLVRGIRQPDAPKERMPKGNPYAAYFWAMLTVLPLGAVALATLLLLKRKQHQALRKKGSE